ncbi:MAG TPA: hypothetical protein VFS44_15135 [Gemmatimonadaceae bacterium]|nr:hypothetical protein [Gemmatimonadaceae bacterium]
MQRTIGATSALAAAAMLAAAASPVMAQGSQGAGATTAAAVDARWQQWLGCWTPAPGGASLSSAPRGALVCVLPAAGASAVDIATVDSGRVLSRERIDASGARVPSSESGCTGWRSASWSTDARRVYVRSEYSCAGGVRRTASGLFAIAPGGEWLDVSGIVAGQSNGVRVVRYRQAAVPSVVAEELSPALGERSLAVTTARSAAAAPVTTADVIDASRSVDAPAVAAWLAALHQDFDVDAKQLVTLANAHVPDRVIDVMVALSYPKVFAIAPSSGVAVREPSATGAGYAEEGTARTVVLDPYGYGYSPYYLDYYPWLGYGAYGLGYGYGYGLGYGWYPGGPVVVIQKPSGPPAPHGRVVNGRGYSRGEDGNGGASSSPRRTSDGGAGARAGGSSGGGRTSTGRTAKPRP